MAPTAHPRRVAQVDRHGRSRNVVFGNHSKEQQRQGDYRGRSKGWHDGHLKVWKSEHDIREY